MVFEMQLKSCKKKMNMRCKSADSGVSVALRKTPKRRIAKSQSSNSEINDFEEELLDFEPDFGDEFDENSQNQSELEMTCSDQSTVKDFNLSTLSGQEDVYSDHSATIDNYSVSNVSVAHARYMLPIPHSDAKDKRESEYIPLCYSQSLSARTTIDSSSESDSSDSDTDRHSDINVQDDTNDNNGTDQSGDANDENSSSCSMTQEEEDRLLDSSEDESPDATPDTSFDIQTDAVVTCQIGNARITLPTFVSSSIDKNESNDLKRNKSKAKLQTLECKKKKKKWDLPFKPECPITRVFLNDIGYVSEESNMESDVDRNSLSQPTINLSNGLVRVISNKENIVGAEPRANSPREIISSQIEENSFKLPLPPPKRPPTRLKRTVSNSAGPSKNLQIKFSNKDDDFAQESPRELPTFVAPRNFGLSRNTQNVSDKDDAISIIASTIGGDITDDVSVCSQLEDTDSFTSDQPNNFETNTNFNYIDDRVKQWVQNVANSETSQTIPNLFSIPPPQPNFNGNSLLGMPPPQNYNGNSLLGMPPVLPVQGMASRTIPDLLDSTMNQTTVPQSFKEGGISVMPSVLPKGGNLRINFKEIPKVYGGLCFHHYFTSHCLKPKCSLAHLVNIEKYVHKILRLDSKEIFKQFQFSKSYAKLFKEIYPAFMKAFGRLKMQNELITSIKYFLEMEQFNVTEAMEHAVRALEESGLSFQEAIEMISFNIGFLEHPVLADILLDLITRSHDISENWGVIKRISKARGKIKPSIVSRILLRMINVYPVNKELCREIYGVIVQNNMTDLSQISEDVLIPVRKLLDFQDGTLKSNTVTDVSQIPSLTVPNPKEVLAAHIDNKLIRERALYERKVEGTTVRTKIGEAVRPVRNFNLDAQRTPSDNRSQSSGSDDHYFQPTVRLSPFSPRNITSPSSANSQYLGNNAFSRATSTISNNSCGSDRMDLNHALRFEPPSEISEYVPEKVRTNRTSSQEAEITLTPSRPILGSPTYRSNFNFDKSLHNLLPDSFEHVSINERDIAKLNSVIKLRNGSDFYELLQYYKSPPTIQNFITMTLANLKSSVSGIHDTLISFTRTFESINPDYAKDKIIKGIIEVIVMNSLFQLEKKGLWIQASNLLQRFCDWDSLVSSKIFSKRSVTPMGRYIFLAKIFSKANHFHLTYEILQNPNLKLLGAPDTWPYFYSAQPDIEIRNTVLSEFFKNCRHQSDITHISDMYKRVYKYGGIYGFDAHVHFNPMLIALINDKQVPSLKYFLPDIDVYYKAMEKNVLRAFTIMLAEQLNQENLFRLYEFCCERQIYTNFTGDETCITVRNNFVNVEVQLILNYYFYKISKSKRLPTGNVTIQIKLMENKPLFPKMLQKCIRSIKEINNVVKKILKDQFSIYTSETPTEQFTVIEIRHEQIKKWLQCNQMWFPIYS